MKWLVRLFRNWRGRSLGYSGCLHCGDSWLWKESHTTMYCESRGMFPLCEECYEKLWPGGVARYYRQLLNIWRKGGSEVSDAMEAQVLTVVRFDVPAAKDGS